MEKKRYGVYATDDLFERLDERAVLLAQYMIENNATVRQTAAVYGVSKSTVHKDVTERLIHIKPELAQRVRKVLDINKAERHIRGGLATREKYLHEKYRNTGEC